MSNLVFPSLLGLMFDRKRSPQFSNIIQRSVSGKVTAARLWQYPLRTYEFAYDYLPSCSPFHWQTLEGFYCQMGGSFDTFLFSDLEDNSVIGQQIGVGDGVTASFQMVRSIGGFTEPLFAMNGSPVIYVGGAVRSSGWSIDSGGLLTFSSGIPVTNAIVTADFNYYWRCRFVDDTIDFNNIWNKMWELKKLSFITEKGS